VARDFVRDLGIRGKYDGYLEDLRFIVTWAVGHLVELALPEDYDPRRKPWRLDTLPITPDAFQYKPISKTRKQLTVIRRPLASSAVAQNHHRNRCEPRRGGGRANHRFQTARILTFPEETVRWEAHLDRIARGDGPGEAFLNEIKKMVMQMMNEFKADPKGLGPCPSCGGEVISGKRDYGCANWRKADGGCRFVIWKEMAQKPITPRLAGELLLKGRTGLLDDFVSKKGTIFSAALKLVQEGDRWTVRFDFGDDASDGTSPKVIGKCPACGGNVTEGPKAYGCAQWREADGGCKFVVWRTIAQKEIPPAVVAQLIEKGVTDLLSGFISRKGASFSARLRLSNDGQPPPRVVFDFSDASGT